MEKPENQNDGTFAGPQACVNPELAKPMTTRQWIGTFLLLMIPLANIVLLIIWAVGDGVNLNKRNFARAYWVLILIVIVLYILFFVLFFSAFYEMLNGFHDYY